MAAGDVVSSLTSTANNGTLSAQPGSGVEWVLHNVYFGGAMELYYTDGTNSIKIDSDTTLGARLGTVFHVNNTRYIQIKNVSGGTVYLGYDGVITK